MIYNLYELSNIYSKSVRFFQKKYKDFSANRSESQRQLNPLLKDNRQALKNEDLKEFITFCQLDVDILQKHHSGTQRIGANRSEQEKFKAIIKQQDKMIASLQEDKKNLMELFEKESFRKDTILLKAVSTINSYEQLNNNVIKSIDYIKNRTIDILRQNKNICIIEDDEDFAQLLKTHIEERTIFDVFIFSNVTEATQYYFKKAFSLTILDLNLSDSITGEKFFETLKNFNLETPVIIISGESKERIEDAVQITNALCYYDKPIEINELIGKINSLDI